VFMETLLFTVPRADPHFHTVLYVSEAHFNIIPPFVLGLPLT
jgi:hypothetical protein